jgi:hypothetical protein
MKPHPTIPIALALASAALFPLPAGASRSGEAVLGAHPSAVDVPYRVVRSPDPPATDAIEPAALPRVTPNPGGGMQRFAVRVAPGAGAVSIRIHDLAGRLVWSRDLADLAPGSLSIEWDGRDNDGARAPGAVYLARVRDADGVRGFKLVRLP